jgi:nucleotide-binding universal stress UspA family protein
MLKLERILVPVDFTERSRRAVEYAVELAQLTRASVRIFHVWQIPPLTTATVAAEHYQPLPPETVDAIRREASRNMEIFIGSLTLPQRLAIHVELQAGDPASAIENAIDAHAIDLVVMGTHGRRGLSRFFLGSVAEKVMRTARCPILTIRMPSDEEGAAAPARAT